MTNLRKSLEEAERLCGEQIEAIVVGKHDDRLFDKEALPDENIVLSREDGLKKLDQEYDSGFGGADCFPLYAWTATRVYLVHEYDGATGLVWVPRSPKEIEPEFGGQSSIDDFLAARGQQPSAQSPTA